MITNTILICLAAAAVFMTGLFAGSETGMYQLSRIRLRLGIARKQLPFVILGKSLSDSPGLLISLLIGANLSCYITTSIVTYILMGKFSDRHTIEILATLITTPIIFMFGEMIPKNLFLYRADVIMPWAAPVIFIFHKFCKGLGIVPLLSGLTRFVTRIIGPADVANTAITTTQKHQIGTLLKEGADEGVLTSIQTDIINRMTTITGITISSVMIPLEKAKTIELNSNRQMLLDKLKESAFTRLPVYDKKPANIIGYINVYEALDSKEDFASLQNFIQPIRQLPADTSVLDAIGIIQKEKHKIALVTKSAKAEQPVALGIVTMKDLVEELFGELAEW